MSSVSSSSELLECCELAYEAGDSGPRLLTLSVVSQLRHDRLLLSALSLPALEPAREPAPAASALARACGSSSREAEEESDEGEVAAGEDEAATAVMRSRIMLWFCSERGGREAEKGRKWSTA